VLSVDTVVVLINVQIKKNDRHTHEAVVMFEHRCWVDYLLYFDRFCCHYAGLASVCCSFHGCRLPSDPPKIVRCGSFDGAAAQSVVVLDASCLVDRLLCLP